jgi:peptidoglycan hydrolase CwlO-like protein
MTPTMHPMISGAASTGQQYEMLLREKTELQHQAQQLGQ